MKLMIYNSKAYNIISIIEKSLFLFIIITFVSCIKDENIEIDNISGIKISIDNFEDYDSTSDTKSSFNKEIYSKTVCIKGREARIRIVEDNGKTKNVITKASGVTYTVLVYNKGNKSLVTKLSGVADNNGNFIVKSGNYKKLSVGDYIFVCVANGTVSSNGATFTFKRNDSPDEKVRPLVSSPIEKSVTKSMIDGGNIPLSFVMRYQESGIRVAVLSEEVLPAGVTINLETKAVGLPISTNVALLSGSKTYSGTDYPTLIYTTKSTGSSKYLTTEYKYFYAVKNNFKIRFSGATVICGYDINDISSTLEDNLGKNMLSFSANKRYTIHIDFRKVKDLSTAEINNLPAWRVARYNMKTQNTFANSDRTDASGYFNFGVAFGYWGYKEINIGGVNYHQPNYDECMGIMPNHEILMKYDKITTHYENIQIGYYTKPEWYIASYYPNIGNNDHLYGIKLMQEYDYSKACAYKYEFRNSTANYESVVITVIYLGNEAKKYNSLAQLKSLFNNSGSRQKTMIIFPLCGYKITGDNNVLERGKCGKYWTNYHREGDPKYYMYFRLTDSHVCHLFPAHTYDHVVRFFR